ncbi:hypothetical protein FRB99_002175 [Tulasnella sp. 403]|nr:hypothetical protein FRB99_002175 [Tulasnella sp. 403]
MEGTTAKEDTASAQAERLAALLPLLSAIRTFDGPTNPSGGIKTSNEALQRFARACGDPEVKQAFERAAELEKADSVIVPLTREEEERYNPKRRRITKDDHVDVPPPTGPPPLQPLAPVDPNEPILTLSNISQYLQHTHTKPKHPKLKVQIWLPSQTSPTGTLPNPVTLKLTHSNLFFVYISCLSESTYGPLRIRKVVVFGPREKVRLFTIYILRCKGKLRQHTQRLPHMQSEYMIFRTMSQVLAKVVDQAPDITLPQLMVPPSPFFTNTSLILGNLGPHIKL